MFKLPTLITTPTIETKTRQHLVRNAASSVDQISERNLPPSFRECPVEDIVVYNRSAWARKDAIEHLKKAWPGVRIHEIGLTGQSKTDKSDSFIGLSSQAIDDNEEIRKILLSKGISPDSETKSAFYLGWQPKAEDASFVSALTKMGTTPVAASPETLEQLAKKQEFKAACDDLGITTSSWGRLKGLSLDEATDLLYEKSRSEAQYLKSDFGGGGRGTKRLGPDKTKEEIKSILIEMKSFSRNDIENIYFESAVTPKPGNRLLQLEVEVLCDRHGNITVDPNSRYVCVNDKNQKFTEWGFQKGEDCGISEELLAKCREEAIVIAKSVNYNGKGTIEFLLDVDQSGNGTSSALELNGRVQCEWKALALLSKQGHEITNTHALQVLSACGKKIPDESAFTSNVLAVAHDRIIVTNPSEEGWDYPTLQVLNIQLKKVLTLIFANHRLAHMLITKWGMYYLQFHKTK